MVLSDRERYILTATIVAVALAVLSYAASLYGDSRAGTKAQQDELRKKVQDAKEMIAHRDRIAPRWRQMVQVGMKSDPGDARSQVLNAIQDWSDQAGVKLKKQKPEISAEKTRLPEIKFQAKGTGTMQGLVGLLWRINSANIPIRITEMKLDTNKEGADDLTFTLNLSTVYLPSKRAASGGPPDKPAAAPGRVVFGGP